MSWNDNKILITDLPIIAQNQVKMVVEESMDLREDEDDTQADGSAPFRRSKRGLHQNKTIWDGQHQVNVPLLNRLNLRKAKIGVRNTPFLRNINWDMKGGTTHICDWNNFHSYVSQYF